MDRLLLYMATTLAAGGVVVFLARRLSRSSIGGAWWSALPALGAYGILVAWRPGGILLSNAAAILAAVFLAVLGTLSLALSLQGASAAVAFAVPAAGLLVALVVGFLGGGAPGVPFMALAALAFLAFEKSQRRR